MRAANVISGIEGNARVALDAGPASAAAGAGAGGSVLARFRGSGSSGVSPDDLTRKVETLTYVFWGASAVILILAWRAVKGY